MSRARQASVALCIAFLTTSACPAVDLQLTIMSASGRPVPDAVFIVTAAGETTVLRSKSLVSAALVPVVVDQIDKQFVPEVLVIRAGVPVFFPNSDSVAHQVYSFSPAKRFALPLYRGRPYPPVIFDKPGIVTLGCNIHDQMVGYIVVSDAPYFAQSNADGHAVLKIAAQGTYRISVWHPRFNEQVPEQAVTIADSDAGVDFRLTKPMQAARRAIEDHRIRDY